MVVDGKCSLSTQQRPLESFNVTQHLPYVNLRNADQEDLRGVVWVYQDCSILFGTILPFYNTVETAVRLQKKMAGNRENDAAL